MNSNRIDKQQIIGREREREFLTKIANSKESSIIIVHGKRRVGKTTLIEEVYKNRNILKIEGTENGNLETQLKNALLQLSPQLPGQPVSFWKPKSFLELFYLLAPVLKTGVWTFFLEEYQWLSRYQSSLTAEIKIAWDNLFRKNQNLLLVICGSSPSFIIRKVLESKALHNRSQYELHVKPMPFHDAAKLLPKNTTFKDAFDAYLLVGGIPEYLKRLGKESSCYLSFVRESYLDTGFFVNEYRRILISSLAENPKYAAILSYLGSRNFADRSDLVKSVTTGEGGTVTNILEDLSLCGFIRQYTPIDKRQNSKLIRYTLCDPFLRTYFKQIEPRKREIALGLYNKAPERVVSYAELQSQLGYAFQEYCLQRAPEIAQILQFAGVRYRVGSYFSRKINKEHPGYQMDLVFERDDKVHTLCEIKYAHKGVGTEVIEQFDRAVTLYKKEFPKVGIQNVLISAWGVTNQLKDEHYFDRIIEVQELSQS